VYLPIWTLHHDQDLWPRAAEFLPERHIPGNKELQPSTSNAYTPFGHGARSVTALTTHPLLPEPLPCHALCRTAGPRLPFHATFVHEQEGSG
jgi:hypothetical protein